MCSSAPLPSHSLSAWGVLCFPLWAGASTVLLEKLTPPALLEAIERYRATICVTSPTGYRQMTGLVSQHDIKSLKKCVSAGEALPVDTRKKWQEVTGIQIYDGIGGTELIHIYLASDPENYREGALGKILPGYRGMLVDDQMKPTAVGETGKLALKGPTGCRYLSDDRQTSFVKDGWNITETPIIRIPMAIFITMPGWTTSLSLRAITWRVQRLNPSL